MSFKATVFISAIAATGAVGCRSDGNAIEGLSSAATTDEPQPGQPIDNPIPTPRTNHNPNDPFQKGSGSGTGSGSGSGSGSDTAPRDAGVPIRDGGARPTSDAR